MHTNGENTHRLNERLNDVENKMASVVTKVENIQGDITGLVLAFNTYVADSNKSEKTNWGGVMDYRCFCLCIGPIIS